MVMVGGGGGAERERWLERERADEEGRKSLKKAKKTRKFVLCKRKRSINAND